MKLLVTAAAAALMLAACSPSTAPASDAAATPETAAAPAEPAAPAMTSTAINGPIAGKWKVTITSSGMTLPPQEVCYAKQVSLEEAQQMQQQAGITCSENTFTPVAGGMTGHSVCKMAANAAMKETTITTDTRVSGDFNTAYTMETSSTMDPAPAGLPPGPSQTSIKMERLGDCDAGAPAPQ
jgi:hypothetical protein